MNIRKIHHQHIGVWVRCVLKKISDEDQQHNMIPLSSPTADLIVPLPLQGKGL